MRVGFLLTEFPSLSETFILNQISGLLENGQEVRILSEKRGNRETLHEEIRRFGLLDTTAYLEMPDSHPVRFCKALGLVVPTALRRPLATARALNGFRLGSEALSLRPLYYLNLLLRAGEFPILHCHFGPNGDAGVMLRGLGAPIGKVVTSFYGTDVTTYVRRYGRECYRRLAQEGDLFLVLSEHMRRQVVELGFPEERVKVHRLGIRMERFPCHARRPVRKDERIHILTIARHVEKKGIEYGLRAFRQLIRAGSPARYRLIGDGPLRPGLEAMARSLGIQGSVDFLGWQDQEGVAREIENARVLLAPSVTASDGDEEGTPTVLMEAMASGMPVVSTRHSGIPEVVEDGVSGFLVAERDVDALADRLRFLLDHPERWKPMGLAGRTAVAERHDSGRLTRDLLEHYRALS